MTLFPLCLIFASFIRWTGKLLGVVKGLLEPPFWSCEDYTCKPKIDLLFLPLWKNWVASPTRTDTSTHPVGKFHLSSYSLRERASQEGLGATPRLPQETRKGKRRDRGEGLRDLPCNPISLGLSLRRKQSPYPLEWQLLGHSGYTE